MGLYLGLLLRPKFLNLVTSTHREESSSQEPQSPAQGYYDNPELETVEAVRLVNMTGVLGSQRLLFVGVMTAHRYLGTRATSVYDTWAADVPGKKFLHSLFMYLFCHRHKKKVHDVLTRSCLICELTS